MFVIMIGATKMMRYQIQNCSLSKLYSMIYLIGNSTVLFDPFFKVGSWNDFLKWLYGKRELEFDIETNVTPYYCDKKLITMQFGDVDNQWVLQRSELTDEQFEYIRMHILENPSICKLIHNAKFECVIMRFHGVHIRNVYDTMVGEQVLYGGDQDFMNYGLDDICWRRFKVFLDKTEQTTFGDNILTPSKILYAAQDVRYLGLLKKEQYQECQQYGLENVIALEMATVEVFSEMTWRGMGIDEQWWIDLEAKAVPIVAAAEERLNEWLKGPELSALAYQLGYLNDEDQVLINWGSGKQKALIFEALFPELPGTTKAILSKWSRDAVKDKTIRRPSWLKSYLDGDMDIITQVLTKLHREFLIENNLLVPANTPTINWNSTVQVLPLFQHLDKKIKDLSADSMGRFGHPIVLDYQHYKDSAKLISTYGSAWLKKNVEPDGRVRTSFNQVLTTGRISSAKPNMQQIPAKEEVGNIYRNAFVPPVGWSFVSSDYVSQELIMIAYLSQDPVWMEALSKGQDLHSVCADLVYGKKWADAADADCAYFKRVVNKDGQMELAKKKCNCKKHKWLRTGIKTINFGLAYGMSKFKLAATLRIPVPDADLIIHLYFRTFPTIGKLLTYFGTFAVQNGYIKTIKPFFRRRWFPHWQMYQRFIDAHLMEAQYHPGLGEIERAGKNMPIQGTSADTMKVALCLLYWEIHDVRKIPHLVHLVMQVHDQADSNVHDSFKNEWAVIQNNLMEEAAKFIIPTGLLKSETTITDRWSK